MNLTSWTRAALLLAFLCPGAATGRAEEPSEAQEIAEEAYIYAFPMIANYKTMYQFAVDRSGPQYKAPFNQIARAARLATPKDSTVVTPNHDTPYALLWMDLRAEPLVLGVPELEKGRYYSVQLIDLYTHNFGYIGSRPTGNAAGQYLVAGPAWKGDKPDGIARVFRCETELALAIYRTQLFQPADMDNVKKIQEGYQVQPLSAFQKKPAPPAPSEIAFLKFSDESFRSEALATVGFLLQFCPAVEEEKPLRTRLARIGIEPGKPFAFDKLPVARRAELGLGMKQAFEKIKQKREALGEDVNGWRMGASFGDRAFFKGDRLLRAAAALAALYGNDAAEALYPIAYTDSSGAKLDGSQNRYTITFPDGQLPPVNAFWSVTIYDAKTQLLIANPIDRYVINSPMLPDLKKNADGSLTIHVQKDSPGKDREANWLPAPDRPFYLVLRLFWPKESALTGQWKPPAVVRVEK
jgi:hypothetical protein